METIEKLVPTTPRYKPTTRKMIQQPAPHRKVSQKPLPSIHKYNTRSAKTYDEATLPRVGQANIIYKGTPLNIHEIFPEK